MAEARAAMRTYLKQWEKKGFSFTLNWLLRNISAGATGRAEFSSLDMIRVTDFREALETAAGYVSHFLDVAAGHLGLAHDRVLMGRMHAARDFGNGLSLSAHLSGPPGAIRVRHVFPKGVLCAAGYGKGQVNAVANFCFLNRETSLVIRPGGLGPKKSQCCYLREAWCR